MKRFIKLHIYKNHYMLRLLGSFILVFFIVASCAYFNTFFLAKKNFNDAERQRLRDNGVIKSDTTKLYKEAIDWSSEILTEHTTSRYVDDSLYIIGMSHYYQKEFLKARTKFDELLGAFPESEFTLKSLYYKAKCLIELDQKNDALLILLDLENSKNTTVNGLAGLAIAEMHLKNGEWSELLNVSQRIIDLNPPKEELFRAIFYKGNALYQLQQYEECIQSLQKLSGLKIETELKFNVNSLSALANAKLGNYEEAMTFLVNMENKGEFSNYAPRIQLEIGNIYELKGEDEVAIDVYRKMAGDFPDSLAAREGWYNVGRILLKDLSKASEAKDAFDMVIKGGVKTSENWFVEAQIKSVQIDSMLVKIREIEKIEDDPENLASARFSLAEIYTYSFDRPDSAITQYKLIVEEAPYTEYAIKSEYFLKINELKSEDKYSDESEKALMTEIVEKYPESEFAQKLRVFLGLIEEPPDVIAFMKAEHARMINNNPNVYIPFYQAVVDSFPKTKSSYQARFLIAYYYEHDVGDYEKSFELYRNLASEESNVNSEVYVNLADDKLKYAEQEEKLLKEIKNNIAYYEMKIEEIETNLNTVSETANKSVELNGSQIQENVYSGLKKIRARNARIRSRYYTN